MEQKKKRLILIDSNALIHRAYHALPPLTKKDGTLTNAVYGYALTLLSVMDKFKPDYIAAAFDLAGPTFRHEQYEHYKATRKKAPDELYEQIPLVKGLVRAFRIPIYELKGFEADDVIGTVVKSPQIDGQVEKIIVTGDLDALQLVDENTKVFTLRRGITDTVIYDIEKVKERYALEPWQMVEYKALRGDTADNIPGVKGIGEKTAIELLLKYRDVENVYANIELISSASVKKKLVEGQESALMSKKLAQIDTQVPIDFDLQKCVANQHDRAELLAYLKEMEFYSLAKRLEGKAGKNLSSGKSKEPAEKSLTGKKKDNNDSLIKEKNQIEILNTDEKVKSLVEIIRKEQKFGFWFLSGSEKYFEAKVEGLGLCVMNDKEKFISFVPAKYLTNLKDIFQDKKILKVGYNIKLAMELLAGLGTEERKEPEEMENFFDVQIAAYLLRSGLDTDLEKLILEEFGAELEYKVLKKGQASLLAAMDDLPYQETAERAFWILKLHENYEKRIEEISQEQAAMNRATLQAVYENLELPLVKILAKMEMAGVKVDATDMKQVSDYADQTIKGLEKKIYDLAGEAFNINSPSQMAPILYEKLGIPTQDIRRGKTGFSTNADQLRKIHDQHPIVPLIEEYRELFKIKTTYADALPLLMQPDGRIHANFNQAVTATGRLSSSEPNMQNIPKRGKLAKLIRQSFIAEKGYCLVAADYSQIDLRAAAHLANDNRMIEAFQSGKDIHRATASWVNGIKEAEVTDQQRSESKSLNFGVLYGMGIYGFMRDSGVDRKRAEFFIDQYMKRFSDLKKFLDETKQFAFEHGYVETELGRRRYIPNIKASNYQIRNAAERMAINLPVQGLSADIMKLAMVAVDEKLMNKYKFAEARMILQIHDELIFEVKDELAAEFMLEVKAIMEAVYELRVPLVVEVEKGKNWAVV